MNNCYVSLFRCPFCRHPIGPVTLDMDAVDKLSVEPHPPIHVNMETADDFSPFIFSGSAGNRPCPHLIDGYSDVDTRIIVPHQMKPSTLCASLGGSVAPLLRGKYGEDLECWFWENFVDEELPEIKLSTAYEVFGVYQSHHLAEPKREVSIAARIIVAQDPAAFIAELTRLYEQSLTEAPGV